MLRYVLNKAPRAIKLKGRGSSGIDSTAAVTTDWRGASVGLRLVPWCWPIETSFVSMSLKMGDIGHTAIHEVMQQGRMTISKAGIHASLNACCSLLAYDQCKAPRENIDLQDSLLSRFDLLFVLLDVIVTDHDRMISDHVTCSRWMSVPSTICPRSTQKSAKTKKLRYTKGTARLWQPDLTAWPPSPVHYPSWYVVNRKAGTQPNNDATSTHFFAELHRVGPVMEDKSNVTITNDGSPILRLRLEVEHPATSCFLRWSRSRTRSSTDEPCRLSSSSPSCW
ncbi:hypothetical protein pipiens_018304 [Culex pipiens pipiens]|uniref:MCM C-terminal AAA(+) ATPase domain-containing protein n=1 Tax=Culex pipiens pipiens TaxID=38569 RepID=A0ABD1CCD4_CULPP